MGLCPYPSMRDFKKRWIAILSLSASSASRPYTTSTNSNFVYSRPDWADDVSDTDADPNALPQPTTTTNKDGTKTTISYRIDDSGRKVRVTRKTRTTVHKERVNPAVAERRSWAKFGLEKGKPKGPQPDTTSVGENIQFRPSRDWKSAQAEEAKNGGPKGK